MVHVFNMDDIYAAVDTNSGSVHILDELTYELLKDEQFRNADSVEKISEKYGKADTEEALSEINELIESGALYSKSLHIKKNFKTVVKAMCLNVAHDCNLKCNYCFASQGNFGGKAMLMPFEVGKKAFDFLVENSGNRRNLEVDFFGGEPLMNFEVVKQLVEYGRELEKTHDKHFRFTITTNGVLLNDEIIDYINENMDNCVLSLDGRKEVNDRMRRTANDKGSYDIIMENFKKLVEKRDKKTYYLRGTFTKYNLDFAEDVKHMHEEGFKILSMEPVVTDEALPYAITAEDIPLINEEYEKLAKYMLEEAKKDNSFQFFHFYLDLDKGPCIYKRAVGCGAGSEYLAVTPEGHFYPCHQFVGEEEYIIGNVDDGILRPEVAEEYSGITVDTKEACNNCWAKYFCSGGCHANAINYSGDIHVPYAVGCELERKRVECSIYLKAKLAELND